MSMTREERRRIRRRQAMIERIVAAILVLGSAALLLFLLLGASPTPALAELEPTPPLEIPAAPEVTEHAQEPEPAEPQYEAELELLALVIYQEAGGDAQSDETRRMVGEVALNRVADPRFPDTLADVLTQKQQYGRLYWTGLVWPERASTAQEAHAVERAYECAALVLEAERLLPADTIYQAEFIQGEIVAQVPGYYFCIG